MAEKPVLNGFLKAMLAKREEGRIGRILCNLIPLWMNANKNREKTY